ncbi:DUF4238 domain-containing protein [Roseibium sp.]|uniref:DUF4238 domain-containing protein n=1 Tax=Roseibium sp. TaxID=1936156 RepID=UPI003D0C203F
MAHRTKRQHFVPRFYLKNFCDADGYIWTHDSRRGDARRSTPENTGLETNIYSPEVEDGERFDEIEEFLAKTEGAAAPLLTRLSNSEKLDADEKAAMALFIASMFVRSPAQIRQFAALAGDMASWITAMQVECERNSKQKSGEDTKLEEVVLDYLGREDGLKLNVDRRAGLMGFVQLEPISRLIENMTWSFEVSKDVELITSDNPVFWVASEKIPRSPYGFGLAHRLAVVPFPLSPSLILRIDHGNPQPWRNHHLDKRRAKLANKMRAEHKDHCLYYRTHHDGLHQLGMKYPKPVQQVDFGYSGPKVNVVRKLKN